MLSAVRTFILPLPVASDDAPAAPSRRLIAVVNNPAAVEAAAALGLTAVCRSAIEAALAATALLPAVDPATADSADSADAPEVDAAANAADLASLAGADVLVLSSARADAARLDALAVRLHVHAHCVRLARTPTLPRHVGAVEASDWMRSGATAAELVALREATPAWAPSTLQAAAAHVGAFLQPDGYRLTMAGLEKAKMSRAMEASWVSVSRTTVWIDALARTSNGGATLVSLRALDNGSPRSVGFLNLGAVNSARLLAEWAAEHGLVGLTGETAAVVLDYLIAAYRLNADRLPTTVVATALGFERDNAGELVAFVHGGKRHTVGTEPPTTVALSPTTNVPAKLYRAFRTNGDAAGWARAFALVRARNLTTPVAMLGLGVASLLNDVLGTMPMVCAMAGDGGGGKTTALRFVGSALGRPDETYRSARLTANALEGYLAFAGDLPLLLDETGSMGGGRDAERDLAQVVYMVSERSGKGRMRKDLSLRDSASWACNLLTTGELDAGAVSSNTGVRRRVFTLWGAPLGPRCEETRQFVATLEDLTNEHYGHVAPAIAAHILNLDDDARAALKVRHRRLADAWVSAAADVDTGLIAAAAAQMASAQIILEWIAALFPAPADLGGEEAMPMLSSLLAVAWESACKKLRVGTRPERVLDVIRRYFATYRAEFEGCDPALLHGRPAVMVTRGKIAEVHGIDAVAFDEAPLAKALADAGFNIKTDLDHLRDQGILMMERGSTRLVKVRFNGSSLRMATISLDTLCGTATDEALGEFVGFPF